MNNLNINQTGGFPLSTKVFDFLQTAHTSLINALGAMAGSPAIISGCQDLGASISDGFVQIGSELLRFQGGVKMSTVVIVETKTQRTFQNGETKDVYIDRFATFGSGTTTYNWADFKRVPKLTDLTPVLPFKKLRIPMSGTVSSFPTTPVMIDGYEISSTTGNSAPFSACNVKFPMPKQNANYSVFATINKFDEYVVSSNNMEKAGYFPQIIVKNKKTTGFDVHLLFYNGAQITNVDLDVLIVD